MEKDKTNGCKITACVTAVFNRIISQVHFLDPSDNTKKRVLSAMILLPIGLLAILYSDKLFIFLAIAITILMSTEWTDMIKSQKDQTKWRLIGLLYILIPVYSAIQLRMMSEEILFWMFAIIWATDIFAFFGGKTLGGIKLVPSISPNKTWSGLSAGVAASAIIGLLTSLMFPGSALFFMTISALLAVVEQLSDILESKFKRLCGVKDSGNLIPGHGGVLDRLDGMMLLAPCVCAIVWMFPQMFRGNS